MSLHDLAIRDALGAEGYVEAIENQYSPDPFKRRILAYTNHGNHLITAPFITEIRPNLWLGGIDSGLELPPEITNVISLYQGLIYEAKHGLDTELYIRANDSVDQDTAVFDIAVEHLHQLLSVGRPTLVHCQAGINRSATVVALYLVFHEGLTPDEAIQELRTKRDQAVLCNPTFEAFVRSYSDPG